MLKTRSISRELALLVLGQISDKEIVGLNTISLEGLMNRALESLTDHLREGLDNSARELENAQQELLDSDLQESDKS